MSDLESISPEDPWITEDGLVIDANPSTINVETGEEKDIEKMADPRQEGDVPEPSPPKKAKKLTDEELWNEYLEAYDELNKFKNKQEHKISEAKKSFKRKNPDASIQEQKANIESYKNKMKCLNCGKTGIIVFNDDSAKCGAQEPCNLNIKIVKPSVTNIPDQLEKLRVEINLQKRIITEYKLDLLFDLDDEEVILNEFQNNKQNLERLLEYASELQEYYDRKTKMIEGQQFHPDTGEQLFGVRAENKVYVSRKEMLNNKQREFNQMVSEFKKDIKNYKKENVLVGKTKILEDALQKYKNIIIPLQDEIKRLKYQVIYLDKISQNANGKINKKEMPIYHYLPKKIDINNQIVQNDDFEVEHNRK